MFHNSVMSVFIVMCSLFLVGESGVVVPKKPLQADVTDGYENKQVKDNVSQLDCSQFVDDYDILRQFPYPIEISLAREDGSRPGETVAFMNKNATSVDTLTISNENVVPSSIFCLSNLDSLQIDGTPFENNIIPDEFANLKTLREFFYYDSPIVKVTEKLGTLTNLFMLILDNCSLTHLPNLSNLQELIALHVSRNRLTHVDGIPDVQFLRLDYNNFNYIPITKKPEKLMFLTLSGNPVKNIAPIMSYVNLEGIYFENTMLTSIPPNIDKLRKLMQIDFSGNQLSHLPTTILNLHRLEDLNISNNLLSINEIQSIQKAFKKSHPKLTLTV